MNPPLGCNVKYVAICCNAGSVKRRRLEERLNVIENVATGLLCGSTRNIHTFGHAFRNRTSIVLKHLRLFLVRYNFCHKNVITKTRAEMLTSGCSYADLIDGTTIVAL
jgi:hypothetical protein